MRGDLDVAGMVKNRSRTLAASDLAMGELVRQFDYEAAWYGTRVIIADRWFALSKTCSSCGRMKEALNLSEWTFACPCGYVASRDEDATVNLARWTSSSSPLLSAVA